jgi:hypothetical protein
VPRRAVTTTLRSSAKGTWKTLVTDGGGTFADQGDCVNDGAQGNAPFGAAGNAECNEIGGEFQLRAVNRWNCLYTSNSTNTAGMREACATDGGTFTTAQGPGGDTVGTCTESP